MSSKILESDVVDSKYFRQAFGRLLSLQMETNQELDGIVSFLHERFFAPPHDSPEEDTFHSDELESEDDSDEGDDF